MSARAAALALAAAALVTATTPPARGDADEEKRLSDKLFYEGAALMANGKVAEACKKLDQSLALARRGGTLQNLALCREALGEFAVALPLFEEALALAEREGRDDRRDVARAHIASLREKLAPPKAREAPPIDPPKPPEPVAPRPPEASPVDDPKPPPPAAGNESKAHGRQFGAIARVDVDPIHRGARVAAGPTYGALDWLEVGASVLLGREVGVEPQLTCFILPRGAWKPIVNVGVPIFFAGGARPGARGAAGLAWDPIRRFGLFAGVGGAYFPNAAAGYARGVLLTSFGVQGRI